MQRLLPEGTLELNGNMELKWESGESRAFVSPVLKFQLIFSLAVKSEAVHLTKKEKFPFDFQFDSLNSPRVI